MTAVYDLRVALLRNGYTPLPCDRKNKRPVITGWPDIAVTPELIASWDIQFPHAQNTGLRLCALDLDISDQEVCADLEKEVADWLDGNGEVLIRFGNPPRRLIPFLITEELSKISHDFKNAADKEQRLELLGVRSQFIAYGTHPKGHTYAWFRDRGPLEVPTSELPQLSAADAKLLFRHLCEVLEQRHGYAAKTELTSRAADTNNDERIPVDAEAELTAMTPANVNDVHIRVIPSLLWRGINPNDVVSLVAVATMDMAKRHGLTEWTERAEVIKHVRPRVGSALKNLFLKDYDPATGTIPSWLCADFHKAWTEKLAAGLSPRFGCGLNGFFVRGYECSAKDASDGGDTSKADAPAPPPPKRGLFIIRPFAPFDPATLPPRQWLYGRHYLRRTVSCTTAPGGFGKSSLGMVEAIAMATCRNLLGEQPSERLRVWLHNGEDSLDEMRRRLAAICQHYGIPQQELVNWFFMTSGNEVPLRVAEGYNKLDINEGLIKCINNQIEDNEIDVVTLDPLITLHGVPESDNTRMDGVIRIFAGIADAHDCSIEISHHMRKPAAGSNGDYGAADIRGASAIHDAVRSARVLNRMSEKDAQDLALQEHDRAKYFRVDKAKGNYSPAIKAVWCQFINVELPNGDDVGVVAPWSYPGQGEATPERQEQEHIADFVFLQLLDRFTLEGRSVSERPSRNYAPALFVEEAEAKMARQNKITLKAAMLRLFKAGKIKAADEDSGGKAVHKIIRAAPTRAP